MTINITLLVQMIHFFVVYYILKIVVLQQAIGIVQKQQQEEEALQAHITDVRHGIDERLKEDAYAFERDKEKAKEFVPEMIKKEPIALPIDKIKHDCLRDGCEMKNIDRAVHEIAASIRKRIEHA